ncbi:hypothetical protein Tco_0648310, partial [Tanacetum coccineum]
MEECHLLLTDQIDLINPEGNQVVHDMSKPLPLRGPLGHSAAFDHNAVRSHMKILSVVSLKTYSRYGYTFLKGQNRKDLPRDNPLVSVEVLRYDIKRSKSENKGIFPTEMELVLEQTQQGTNHEVSIVVMDPVTQCTTLPSHSSEDGNPARATIIQALRAPVLRTSSAAVKPCQGDSSEFYLITSKGENSPVPYLYDKYEDKVDAFGEKAEAEIKKKYAVFSVKDPVITSLHTIDHEIGTRKEKERVVLE